MGYDIEPPSARFTRQESENNRLKLWELNYQEAAIFLQEGENNDKYRTHPASHEALPAYQIAHNKWFYLLDLMAAILILFLAGCEKPAVPWLRLDVGVSTSCGNKYTLNLLTTSRLFKNGFLRLWLLYSASSPYY